MAAYADTDDLAAYWRTLTDDEKARAEALLVYAAAAIDARCPSTPAADAARFVSCDMVKTAMQAGTDTAPVTQLTMTGGPYSRTMQYANPSGDLYWKAQYDVMLGIVGTAVGSICARSNFDG